MNPFIRRNTKINSTERYLQINEVSIRVCLCLSSLHCNIISGVRLMPSQREWPRSNGIDLLKARGNLNYSDENDVQIGVQQVASGLHFEPHKNYDRNQSTVFLTNNATGYNTAYHKYTLIWNEHGIRFFVDDIETGFFSASDGFSKMAPFDQEVVFKKI